MFFGRLGILIGALALAFSATAVAGDAAKGKAKSEFCQECHEPVDFEGEKAADIEAMIKSVIATGKQANGKKHKKDLAERKLSDADIADIAAYFASGS